MAALGPSSSAVGRYTVNGPARRPPPAVLAPGAVPMTSNASRCSRIASARQRVNVGWAAASRGHQGGAPRRKTSTRAATLAAERRERFDRTAAARTGRRKR
ncbi:MAG: hypothetical protein ABW032_07170 [Burkholderiaceae bacterium]